jgi:hypothetical protein
LIEGHPKIISVKFPENLSNGLEDEKVDDL